MLCLVAHARMVGCHIVADTDYEELSGPRLPDQVGDFVARFFTRNPSAFIKIRRGIPSALCMLPEACDWV